MRSTTQAPANGTAPAPPVAPGRPAGTAGPLVIVGGAEDREEECRILREFVVLAGGARARVVVVTVASERPAEVGPVYVELFRRLGVRQVQEFHVTSRDQANEPGAEEVIRQATGVFFTGGDQLRITNLLGGTLIDQALHARHDEGLVLGGTSAGAAMMASTMIYHGLGETSPRVGCVKVGPGMEFMRGTIIDQHFGQRGRSGRLLTALALYPHQLGLGIDENTALIVQGDEFRVVGEGAVTVLDAGGATFNNALELETSQHLAICNVKMHVLTAGMGFNFTARTPVIPAPPAAGRPPERGAGERPAGGRPATDRAKSRRNGSRHHENHQHPGASGAKHLS
jgi:cyanophycinase